MTLSCGHGSDQGNAVICKDYTKTGSRILAYRYVCDHCYRQYRDNKVLFYSDREAEKWLLNV